MVKKFRRPAAGIEEQIPSDLRPPKTLERTLDYLIDEVVGNAPNLESVHSFVWDRSRGIRNDFSVQQLRDIPQIRIAINCFERIVRFHLLTRHQVGGHVRPRTSQYDHQQDLEQCIKTLVSLMAYYDGVRNQYRSPNEAEFRAYWIITRIPDKKEADIEAKMQTWPKDILEHPRVKLAWQIYISACNVKTTRTYTQAIAQQHYTHFWTLINSPETSYMMACAAEIFFDLVRKPALYIIAQAYLRGGTPVEDWTLEQLVEPLGLDTEEEVQEYVEAHGFSVKENDAGDLYLDISNAPGRNLNEIASINPPRIQFFSETLVESKRFARTFPALVNGLSAGQARERGQIDESLFISDDEAEIEDEAMADELEYDGGLGEEVEAPVTVPSSFNPAATSFNPSSPTATAPLNLGTSLFDRINKPSPPLSPASDIQAFTGFYKPDKPATKSPLFSASPFATTTSTTTQPPATTSPFASASPFATTTSTAFGSTAFSQPSTSFGTFPQTTATTPSFTFASQSSNAGSTPSTQAVQPLSLSNPSISSSPFSQPKTADAGSAATTSAPLFPPATFAWTKTDDVSTASQPPNVTQPSSPFQQPSQTGKSESSDSPGTISTSIPPTIMFPSTTQPAGVANNTSLASTFTATPPTFTWTTNTNTSKVPAESDTSKRTMSAPSAFSFTPPAATAATSTSLSASVSPATSSTFGFMKPTTSLPVPPVEASQAPTVQAQSSSQGTQQHKSARTHRRELCLDYLANDIFMNPDTGFLKQYVDWIVKPIYEEEMHKHELDLALQRADEHRRTNLARRYWNVWRSTATLSKRRRQGRERRARLAAEKAARAKSLAANQRKKQTFDYATEMANFEEITEAAERTLRLSAGSTEKLDATGNAEEGNPPIRHAEPEPFKRTPFRRRAQTQISKPYADSNGNNGLNSSSRRQLTEKEQADALLRKSFLTGDPLRDGHATGRLSTVKSNYFKLKAMGLEYLSDNYLKREKRKREQLSESTHSQFRTSTSSPINLEEDELSNAPKRFSLADSRPVSRQSPDASSALKRKVHPEDEALFARARAARKALDEGSAFYRDETRKIEDELRQSQNSSRGSSIVPFGSSGNYGSIPSVRQESEFTVARAQQAPTASTYRNRLLETARDKLPKFWFRDSKFIPRSEYGLGPRHKRTKVEQPAVSNSVTTDSKKPASSEPQIFSSFTSSNGFLDPRLDGFSEAQPRDVFKSNEEFIDLDDDEDCYLQGQRTNDTSQHTYQNGNVEEDTEGDEVEEDEHDEQDSAEEDSIVDGTDQDDEGEYDSEDGEGESDLYDDYSDEEEQGGGRGYQPPSNLMGGNSADDAIEL